MADYRDATQSRSRKRTPRRTVATRLTGLSTVLRLIRSDGGSDLSRLRVSRKVWLMAKMGRPPVAERDYRGEFISVRLRAGEKRAILQAARKAGSQYTDWARSVLLSAARRASGR